VSGEVLAAAAYAGRRAVELALARGVRTDAERHRVFVQALLEDAGLDPAAIEPAISAIREEHGRRHLYSVVEPGTRETLARLAARGFVVGALSNSDGGVRSLLEQAGLVDLLAFVIDSGVVGVEKPDPRIFAMGLEAAGVEAEAAWYVGDIYGIDVVGARRAGMRAILLDPLDRYGALDVATARRVRDVATLVGLPGAG
jgi:HAD superfamily hydrolase (TIGR01509 family)